MSRALVLGGGGVAGAAWETGLLLGLLDSGLDLTAADRIIGTSAGSRVAAEVSNAVPLRESFDRYVGPVSAGEIQVELDTEKLMSVFATAMAGAAPGAAMRRAIGQAALGAATVPERARRDLIASRLPVHTWPDRDVQITAVEARTGELRVFTPTSGVELIDAVAASCAVPMVWPPVTIEGLRYIDGGIRSGTNADLAAGCDVVVVIAPMPQMPLFGPEVQQAVAELAQHATLLTIGPDETSVAAMGTNPLDPATARPSAEAGRAQAAAHGAAIAAVWGAP